MKKELLLLLVLAFGSKFASAQDENELKNFRFGLKVAPMFTWFKPDDPKKFESGGSRAKFGYGLMTEFRLNKVASIATGLEINYDGGKINPKDTNYYFLSKDDDLLAIEDTSGQQYSMYHLIRREYNTTYVMLPLTLKLKTGEIGLLTYFGQFGLNTSIRLKSRVNDVDYNVSSPGTSEHSDLENTSDMNLLKFALNVGGGVELGLAGTTSLVFGLNWYNGFSNVVKPESKYLIRTASNNYEPTKQNARSNAIAITVGVLF
ncbi:MAG TPA: porin family protein [Bacteroidia bacterium]|nr:porin family protein [Bacteroidia bacterium]